MSTLRNIAAHLWRGSLVRKANVVLGVTGAVLSAACAAEQVTGPSTAMPTTERMAALHASASPADAAKAAADSAKKAADAAAKAAKDYSKAQLDSLKMNWNLYKAAVQAGDTVASILRCEPRPTVTVSKVIGPSGGSIKVGDHSFDVPAGALTSPVTITAAAPLAPTALLEFQPHGLQFKKPVEMTISYKGCILPANAHLGVAYVGSGNQILQKMPSHDDKLGTAVSALTDHFSGYMVSWSRE